MTQLLGRVRRSAFAALWLSLLIAGLAVSVSAQRGGGATNSPIPFGQGHMIFGDLKIAGASSSDDTTYQVVLYAGMNVVQRQTVSSNGRFRFMGIPNGEYAIVVENDGREVYRDRFRLAENQVTDIRKDIQLAMRVTPAPPPKDTGLYSRTAANQSLFDQAKAATDKKNFEEAQRVLDLLVANDDKDFVAWAELGTVLFRREKYSEAEKAYQKSLAAKPDFLPVLVNYGKLQLQQKQPEKAVELLTKAIEVDPKSAEAQHYLGEAYLQAKKGSKAVVHLNEALKLDPAGKADIHLRLAALYNAAGMKDRAAVEYEQFLAKRPDYAEKEKLQQYISQNKKP
jgi:cytochrome c-type biogenesis protein CcmH/NrfG